MAPDTTADCAQLSLEAFQEIPCRSGRSGRESDGHREAGVRSLAAALICVFAAAGCAMNPAVDLRVQRGAPTGIAPGERIAILLSRYEKEGVALADSASGSAEQRQRDQIEERLESCLQQSMLAGGSDLAFVSPREARRTLFPGKAISEVPRDPAELLQWAAEAQSNERLALLGLRYLVMLDGRWWTSERGFQSGGYGPFLFVARYGWWRHSTIRATVLDLAHRRNAGEVFASARGEVGGGAVVFFAVVPVPAFSAGDPESHSCTVLGKDLARFIAE